MNDQNVELTVEEKDKIVSERFNAFITSLSAETGEGCLGAIATICWAHQDRVSVAISLGKAPAAIQMRIIDILAQQFVRAVHKIKALVNTHRKED